MGARRRARSRSARKEKALDPRLRAVTTLAEDVPPGPQGQPGHEAGSSVVLVQPVNLLEIGEVTFATAWPSRLLFEAALAHLTRAARLKTQFPKQVRESRWGGKSLSNDQTVLDFFQDAMAGILLLYGALDSFCVESIPDGFEYQEDGRTLEIADIENLGMLKKVSRVLSQALDGTNIATKRQDLWERLQDLKQLRDDIAHVKKVQVYSGLQPDVTLFAKLIEQDFVTLGRLFGDVVEHYGQER